MARVQLSSQGWSPVMDSSGNGRAAVAFTLTTAAGGTVPIYAAATGATVLLLAEKVTSARGVVPGFAEEGTYTLTVEGVETTVEVVSGSPLAAQNVLAYGADPSGTADSTAAINAALVDYNRVVVPPGTYRIDGTVTVTEFRTLELMPGATLIRQTAHSAATTPVVRLNGSQQAQLVTTGRATIQSENASPRGVVHVGPAVQTVNEGIGWTTVRGVVIRALTADTDIALCYDSSQAAGPTGAGAGANYNGLADDLYIFGGGTGIHWGELCNAHEARACHFFGTGRYCYRAVGGADSAHATSENRAFGGFVHTSATLDAVIRLERAFFCEFFGVGAEPGNGASQRYYQIDANSTQNRIIGYGNMSTASTDSGTNSVILDGNLLKAPRLLSTTGLGIGNHANATVLGSVIRKAQVFDGDGASIGFIPIYDAIT